LSLLISLLLDMRAIFHLALRTRAPGTHIASVVARLLAVLFWGGLCQDKLPEGTRYNVGFAMAVCALIISSFAAISVRCIKEQAPSTRDSADDSEI
jgi:hypothetical protein